VQAKETIDAIERQKKSGGGDDPGAEVAFKK